MDKLLENVERLFAGGTTEQRTTQPGSGTTVPTQEANVRLITPDGAYAIDPDKPANAPNPTDKVLELLAEIRDGIVPKVDPYSVKQRHADPRKGAWRDGGSGTIAAGGTSQLALPHNPIRRGLIVQVPSTAADSIWFRLDGQTAVAASPSLQCAAGQTWLFDSEPIPDGGVTVISATTGVPFTIWEAQ